MKYRSLIFAILLLLPGVAHGGLLTGMTPGSYPLPSGWSAVVTQDFEGALSANENMNMSFSTERAHGGSRSVSVPSAPTLQTVAAGNAYILMFPGYAEGATNYNGYYTSDGSAPSKSSTKITGVTNGQKLPNLINGTTYKFVFAAVNGTGEGDVSTVVSATPSSNEGRNYLMNSGNFIINVISGAINPLSK